MSDELLNAYLDGELDEGARVALERRLETDATLRSRLDDLREVDAALRAAYVEPSERAGVVVARVRAPRSRSVSWLLLPLAAAAGVVLGLLLRGGGAQTEPTFLAVPTVATGPLLVATGEGAPREARAGEFLPEGCIVTTSAGARAALVFRDGTEVRLDRGASVRLAGTRRLEIEGGRLWSRVVEGDPFLLAAGETRVTVLGTEVAVDRGPARTEVQLFSGRARVEARGVGRDLAAGQAAVFEEGALSEAKRIDFVATATGWMLELYAYSGRHEKDLAAHMDALLAELGRRKALLVEEDTLVTELAGVCRVPLARFLESEGAQQETEARRKAARVLARIADSSVASVLAKALRDPDAEVRRSAAQAIARLSGGLVCGNPDAFVPSCDFSEADAAEKWAAEQGRPWR